MTKLSCSSNQVNFRLKSSQVKLVFSFAALMQVIFGRRHVGIMSAEPVGNYGVRYV